MKKTISVLFALLMLISCFALTASAVEYKYKGFTVDIPDGMLQDTQWAEENGYADAWYDKDMNYEIILFESAYDPYAGPLLLDFYEIQGRNISKKYKFEFDSEVTSEHSGHSVEINGETVEYYDLKLKNGDETLFNHFQYFFSKGNRTYNLLFYIYNEDYRYTAREIAKSVTVRKTISDYLGTPAYWTSIFIGTSQLLVIRYFLNKRKAKKEYEEKYGIKNGSYNN